MIAGQRWTPEGARTLLPAMTGSALQTELLARGQRADAEGIDSATLGAKVACGLWVYVFTERRKP